MTPRQQQLVNAAMTLLDREGINGFTMRSLAAEIGLSPMAAYKHFENQRALQLELWRACIVSAKAWIAQSLEECAGEPPLDRLMHAIDAFIEYSLQHPNRFELVHHHPFVREVWQESDIDALRQSAWEQFIVIAEEGQAKGMIRDDISAEQLIAMAYSTVHGTCYLLSSGRLQRQTGLGPEHFKRLTMHLIGECLTYHA